MGKDKDFSVCIKSGHVTVLFFPVLFIRLKAFGKNMKIKLTKKMPFCSNCSHKQSDDRQISTSFLFQTTVLSWQTRMLFVNVTRDLRLIRQWMISRVLRFQAQITGGESHFSLNMTTYDE